MVGTRDLGSLHMAGWGKAGTSHSTDGGVESKARSWLHLTGRHAFCALNCELCDSVLQLRAVVLMSVHG